MTTAVLLLDDEARETLHNMAVSVHLDGECYAFAIALSRNLGWKMLGLMPTGGSAPRHAAVYGALDHKLYDVRGSFKQDDPRFGEPFGVGLPYKLKPITEDLLRKVRPVHENTIAMAQKFAESIWPHYPWINSAARRMRAFADDLEALSRKHKIWLRAPYPGAKPILNNECDEEAGYTICPTDDSIAFTIDRRFRE